MSGATILARAITTGQAPAYAVAIQADHHALSTDKTPVTKALCAGFAIHTDFR